METAGKIIDIIGDSITEGVGVSDFKNKYDNVLKEACGFSVLNSYPISGSRIAHQMVPSDPPRFDLCFCGRAYNMAKDADVVMVYGGINDYIHGDAPIGVPTDNTPATFCGGVNFIIGLLKALYPGKAIIFLTPARSCYNGNTDLKPSPRPNKKPDAMPVEGYVNIILDAVKRHGIYTIDLYHDFPVNPNNEEDRAKYTVDGLHFNDAGSRYLGEYLAKRIKEL